MPYFSLCFISLLHTAAFFHSLFGAASPSPLSRPRLVPEPRTVTSLLWAWAWPKHGP
ncbi:hypothetical protein RND81_08G101700 [Saponaria officinalis]|uniref:Uncharacterized protein n=1 Tax=Saponaria officinalis TaxID=3572 RepID=A0AAW1J5U5_SAPOF